MIAEQSKFSVGVHVMPVITLKTELAEVVESAKKIVLPILVRDILSLPVRLMQTVHLVLNKQPVVQVVELYLR